MSAAEVMARARWALEDEQTPYRYSDTHLIRALNDAYHRLKRDRPDLFLDRLVTDAAVPITSGSDLSHLPASYLDQLALGVASRALHTDDDVAGDGGKASIFERKQRSV